MWLLRNTHKHIHPDTLSEYLDGRLQGRVLARTEEKLAECDACRLELEELQATVAMMRQIPMEAPRRSFVMSAPPPEPVAAQPFFALRAPNWVYAGAASVAAIALAVTVSMDATGGLSSDPLRRNAESMAVAPAAAALEETAVTATSDGAAADSAVESLIRESAAPEPADSAMPESESTPLTMAAGAEEPEPEAGPAGGDASAFTAAAPPAEPPVAEARVDDGSATSGVAQTAKSSVIKDPEPSPAPDPALVESPGPELFEGDGGTSGWWRALEVGTGVLALLFMAGLVLRWRANRNDPAR